MPRCYGSYYSLVYKSTPTQLRNVNNIFITFVNTNFTSMNDRLQQFLSAENLTQAQFADSINVAKASISHILAGRNKPGYEFIVNMMKAYPDLNIEWMLTGKGKMYRSANQGSVARAQDSPSGNDEDAPIELGLFSDSIPPISSSQEQDRSGQEDTQLQMH